MSMTAPSTATSSACARSSAPSTTASTRSRRSTASATATRSTEPPCPTAASCPSAAGHAGAAARSGSRVRWVSPLLRRILLVNALPLALLLAALLYLDQYQNGLLEAEVGTLREQARIYAGALGESAVRERRRRQPAAGARTGPPAAAPPDRADARTPRPSCMRPTARCSPTAGCARAPAARWSPSRCRRRSSAAPVLGTIGRIYDRCWRCCRTAARRPLLDTGPSAAGPDWQPDVKEELRLHRRRPEPRDAALYPPHRATTACWSRSPSRWSATSTPSASCC